MTKKLTKEKLAKKLNKWEYLTPFPPDLLEQAKENNLLIVSGGSYNAVCFDGAIEEDVYENGIILTRNEVSVNECDCTYCPYFKKKIEAAAPNGEYKRIRAFLDGEYNSETMDSADYEQLGKPTWCFVTDAVATTFDIYDTSGDEAEYFCRALVIDLNATFPTTNENK